ncbi:hypothetical protein O988_02920 [Pseudogymnoascus sp. VKM F-3808]|nr:hypothetical protein O988_02920 [Pseudogymnoascus sp. VKM F-3808]
MDKALLPPMESAFTDAATSGVVEITVGQGDGCKTFRINKLYFQEKAPIFDRMFSANFKEGIIGSATLPEDSCEAFAAFAKWLHSSKSKSSDKMLYPIFLYQTTSEIRWQMVETIVFADKYCLDRFSDAVMSWWIKYQAKVRLPLEELKKITSYIIANCSNLCKSRDFFAHLWAIEMLQGPGKDHRQPSGDDLDAFVEDINFSKKVFKKMSFLAFQKRDKWQPVCNYHRHSRFASCDDSGVELYMFPFIQMNAETPAPKPKKKRRLI